MAKRISDTQIEIARTAFRNGRSIPEAAAIANMSKASFHKYLRQDIETYMQEHLASKEAKLKPIEQEITPKPQNAISELNFNQFRQYVEQSFAEIGNDQLALKDLHYELQNEHKADYDRLIVIRECYDNALSFSAKPKALVQSRKDSIVKAIKAYASRYGCKIPVPRKLTNWSDDRLYEHITYHVARGRQHSHKEALQICLLPQQQKQEWLEQQLL